MHFIQVLCSLPQNLELIGRSLDYDLITSSNINRKTGSHKSKHTPRETSFFVRKQGGTVGFTVSMCVTPQRPTVFYQSHCVMCYYYLVGIVEEVNRDAEWQ